MSHRIIQVLFLSMFIVPTLMSQNSNLPMAPDYRPSFEKYNMNPLFMQGGVNYQGALALSIPLLNVPGRHGHDFPITINYNSSVKEHQTASFVGLGWDITIGYINRTVVGRYDEQDGPTDPSSVTTTTHGGGKAELCGWLSPSHGNVNAINADIPDMYNLVLPEKSIEMMPEQGINAISRFHLLTYEPAWTVNGLYQPGTLWAFQVFSSDGTIYEFKIISLSTPSFLFEYAEDGPVKFQYPYRWLLTSIIYPDGDTTRFEYEKSTKNIEPLSSIFVDRNNSYPFENYFNFKGNSTVGVFRDYAWPTKIITSTHIAEFVTEAIPTNLNPFSLTNYVNIEHSDNGRRLLYIRLTPRTYNPNVIPKEIRRVVFNYASSNNPRGVYIENNPTNDVGPWIGERLNNNQLTLRGFNYLPGSTIPDDEFGPHYEFSYYNNPQANWIYNLFSQHGAGSYYPGYHCDTAFARAWKLHSVILPTGGKIEYTYEALSEGNFNVTIDPQGRIANPGPSSYWSYKAEPRVRLKAKTVWNGDAASQWTYDYGDAVYDPPSRPINMNFIVYKNREDRDFSEYYYRSYRQCLLGHRWVRETGPDNSWKTSYFTSSYPSAGAESFPDGFYSTDPNASTYVEGLTLQSSLAAMRGLIWKTETPAETTSYTYEFRGIVTSGIVQSVKSKAEYFDIGLPGYFHHKVTNNTYYPALNSITTRKDGVETKRSFTYNSDIFLPVTEKVWRSRNDLLTTEYKYAFEVYDEMRYSNMMSQQYEIKTTGSGYSQIKRTAWALLGTNTIKHWVPSKESIVIGTNEIPQRIFTKYDKFSNLLEEQDAYGPDISGHPSNDPEAYGHRKTYQYNQPSTGRVTTITEYKAFDSLTTLVSYNGESKVSSVTDNNGMSTFYKYHWLGYLSSVRGPDNGLVETAVINTFRYVEQKKYRSNSQVTKLHHFIDHVGLEYQTQSTSKGADTLISHVVYDPMFRVSNVVKPYFGNPSMGPIWATSIRPLPTTGPVFTPSMSVKNPVTMSIDSIGVIDLFPINHAAWYYIGYVYNNGREDWTPFSTTVYTTDGTNRIASQQPAGDSSRPKLFAYSCNTESDGVIDYTDPDNPIPYLPGTLYKTITTDENGIRSAIWKDNQGNTVMTEQDIDVLRLTTRFGYNAGGQLLISIPPKGIGFATRYEFDDRQRLTKKTSPDAGTVEYLYDKNNNLRLIKDENHRGNPNAIAITDTLQKVKKTFPLTKKSDFRLTRPGRVYITLQLLPRGTRIDTLSYSICDSFSTKLLSGQYISTELYQTSIVLPKGLYSFTCTRGKTADTSQWIFTVRSTGGYEFVYRKYDEMNRIIEEGEYNAPDGQAYFTTANAENQYFPSVNTVPMKQFSYDNQDTHPLGAGANNLRGKLSSEKSFRFGSLAQQSFYSYDDYGRVEWIAHTGNGLFTKKITYNYDRQGNLLEKSVIDGNPIAGTTTSYYTYDGFGRLSKVQSSIPTDQSKKLEAEYESFASGKIKRTELGGSVQGVDYRYNERDWLEFINNPTGRDPGGDGEGLPGSIRTKNHNVPALTKNVFPGVQTQKIPNETAAGIFPTDKFAMRLVYDSYPVNSETYFGGITDNQWQYNGNISSIIYKYDSVYFKGKTNALYDFQYMSFDNENSGLVLYNSSSLFYTHNGGGSWDTVITQPYGIDRMSFPTRDLGYGTDGNGSVYKTTDHGFTWSAVASLPSANYQSARMQFLTPDIGFVSGFVWVPPAGEGILNKTTDGGITWRTIVIQNDSSMITSYQFIDINTGYAATQSGNILKTTDGGNTWNISLSVNPGYFPLRKIYFKDASTGFMVCSYGCIFRTTDGGSSWQQFYYGEYIYPYAIQFIDAQKGFMAGEGGVLLKTVDGGMTWTRYEQTYGWSLSMINFQSPAIGYIGGCCGALYRTVDGGMTWQSIVPKVDDSTDIVGYRFAYDRANRLTEGAYNWNTSYWGVWNSTNLYREAMDYDPNGNITQLSRSDNSGVAVPNNYGYYPNTNRLRFLGSGTSNPGSVYRYDGNGNMIRDPKNNVKFIIYDCNNMPLVVYKGSQKIEYTYDAQGNRIQKLVGSTPTYYVNGADGATEMVTSDIALGGQRVYIYGNDMLGHLRFSRGIGSGTPTVARFYYLKDHLGTIRVTMSRGGRVTSFDDYYPYGMQMDGRSTNIGQGDARYKFVGYERDTETGYDYLGHREYDSEIGFLLSVDRFDFKAPQVSPYSYAMNNSIRYIDVNGDSVWIDDNGKRFLYTYNMKYTGYNVAVASLIKSLNLLGRNQAGYRVLTSLIESKGNYNTVFGDIKTPGQFRGNGDDAGGTITLNSNNFDFETIAHEIFHGYQQDKGSGGRSQMSEAEAYLFSGAMSMSLERKNPFHGTGWYSGGNYLRDVDHLLNKYNEDRFWSMVQGFASGSTRNIDGDYSKDEYYLPNQSPVINNLYPLLKRR